MVPASSSFSLPVSRPTSSRQRPSLSSSALRRVSGRMSGGRSSPSGIRAPETSTGITVTSERRSAVPTSSLTKSSGSAIRTAPSSSVAVAQRGPMTTIST